MTELKQQSWPPSFRKKLPKMQASGTGDSVFDVNLPSTLSLEVEASGGSNFTTHGLASAEAFFMQVAGGGLTFVEGRECV